MNPVKVLGNVLPSLRDAMQQIYTELIEIKENGKKTNELLEKLIKNSK